MSDSAKLLLSSHITSSRLDISRLAQRAPEQLAEALTFCMSIIKSQIKPSDLDHVIKHPRHTVEMETAQGGLLRIAPILSLASEAARDADPCTILAACTMLPPDKIDIHQETYEEYRNRGADNQRTPLVKELVEVFGLFTS